MLPRNKHAAEKEKHGDMMRLVPLVELKKLDDEDALPSFFISSSHMFGGHPNKILSFPSHFKFFLLRQFSNRFLDHEFDSKGVDHTKPSTNRLAAEILARILHSLPAH